MRLLEQLNSTYHKISEDQMQSELAQLMADKEFRPSSPYDWNWITPKVYREVSIPNIGRRSDLIVHITDRKIINIECKLEDYGEVIYQAKNHAYWANYSYICFWADTYLPNDIIRKCLDLGLGLIIWRPGHFIEVLQAKHQKGKDTGAKAIRKEILKTLKKKDAISTGKKEQSGQLNLTPRTIKP